MLQRVATKNTLTLLCQGPRQLRINDMGRLGLLLTIVLLSLACADPQEANISCDGEPGSHVAIGRYCLNIVVEGGFECSEEAPFRYDFPDGRVLCTELEAASNALPPELCEEYDEPECPHVDGPHYRKKTQSSNQSDIVIGSILLETGDSDPDEQAARLALAEVNEAGGLLGGKTVSLLSERESNGAESFDALVSRGAVSVIGAFNQDVALQALPRAVANEVPMFSLYGGMGIAWSNLQPDEIWGYASFDIPIIDLKGTIAERARDLQCSTASLVARSDPDEGGNARIESELRDALFAQGVTLGGFTPAPDPFFPDEPASEPSLSPSCADILQADCAIVDTALAGYLLRDCGAPSTMIIARQLLPPLIDGVIEDLSGLNGASVLVLEGIQAERAELLEAAYTARYGQPIPVDRQLTSATAYDQAALTLLAIELAGSTEPRAIRDAIAKVGDDEGEVQVLPGELAAGLAAIRAGKTVNYEGAAGTADYSSGSRAKVLNLCRYVVEGETYLLAPCN